ncbi:pyridoxamine 5'-phosphate oxidase family protein [Saccharopolyspora shandongensis]|uniref:pyridoxamine 5'-phosphate oxidase family protein n=1 Tax=Saccharopolyspora shandongensis TaxID=418495 RepID=UPI0033EF6553
MTPDHPTPTGTADAALLDLELSDPPAPNDAWQAVTPLQHHGPAAVPPRDPFVEERPVPLPGSTGEHLLQRAYGTEKRARKFYDDQVLDHLNPQMKEFIGRMEMAFVATSDSHGECDSSLRAGPPGFLEVLDDRHLCYPEYRGNGVLASLGNISENPHIGILLVDFVTDLIGLHVNGKARIVEDADLRSIYPALPAEFDRGRTPERWVVVQVEEAYIHCRKHIPRMVPVLRTRSWGTDDVKRKGGDYFESKGMPRPWHRPEPVGSRDC